MSYKPQAPSLVEEANRSANECTVEEPDQKRRTYYLPQWTVKPLAVRGEKLACGPILILDSSERLFRKMKEQLETAGDPSVIMLVKQGRSFTEI